MDIFSTLANQTLAVPESKSIYDLACPLDFNDVKALAAYKSDDHYESINTLLRQNKVISIKRDRQELRAKRQSLKEIIADLDLALAKGVLIRPLTVYRGISLTRSFPLRKLLSFQEKGYLSVTLDPLKTKDFCEVNGVLMEIEVPSGVSALLLNFDLFSDFPDLVNAKVKRLLKEDEVLFPRNLDIICTAVQELEVKPGYPKYLVQATLSPS